MSDTIYFIAGLAFLTLAKAKHTVQGYRTPKPFPLSETERSIDYAVRVAEQYIDGLRKYAGLSLEGRRVLELGPGSDLGCGLRLIGEGAAEYVGFDRFDLAERAPRTFYERFAERVPVDLSALDDGRVRYVIREDFDVSAGVEPGVDVVFSNAAFEHFDDVEATVAQLSRVVRSGGVIVAVIDLQTHSRWIRDADPNNIYRYPDWLYGLFAFPGVPNRIRPEEYRALFAANGWSDIRIEPGNRLPDQARGRRVHRRFRNSNLDWLSIHLYAKKD